MKSTPSPPGHSAPPGATSRRKSWYANEWVWLGVIMCLGLGLRVVYLHEIMQDPAFTVPMEDPEFIDYWARGLATGDWAPPPQRDDPRILESPFYVAPGYPYLLSVAYRLAGLSYLVPRVINITAGLALTALVFLIGRRLFGKAAGLIACGLTSLYWAFVYFEGEINGTSVGIAVFAALVYALIRWFDKPSVLRAFVAGLVLGLACLFRANAALFGPVIVAWMLWVIFTKRSPEHPPLRRFGRFFICAAAITIGTFAAISPATVHNYRASGEFILTCLGQGYSVFFGNNEDADGVTTWAQYTQDLAGPSNWTLFMLGTIRQNLSRRLGLEHPMKWNEVESHLAQRGTAYMKRNPGRVLALLAKKAYLFWSPKEISSNAEIHYEKAASTALRHLPGFPFAFSLFVLGLVLFFVNMHAGRHAPSDEDGAAALAILILLLIATYYASFLPFTVNGRYRTFIIPFMFLFGGYGIGQMARLAVAKRITLTAACIAGAMALYFIWSVEFIRFEPNLAGWHLANAMTREKIGELDLAIEEARKMLERDDSAYAHTYFGQLLSKSGQHGAAVEHYRRALEINPYYAYAHNNLGYELAQCGEYDEALSHYRTALEVNPNLTLAHNNLGNLLLGQGNPTEAVEHFRTALETNPHDEWAEYNWGRALYALRDYEQAVEHYERAAETSPQNPDIPNNMGLALAALGRLDEAVEQYRTALSLAPNHAAAHNNLGFALERQGKTGIAIEQYNEAITCDPAFTLAYNNLGNLLAAQGEQDKAVDLFTKAIEKNPRDPYAHYNLGNLLAKQNRLDEAVKHFEKALENNPHDPNIPNNLGLALAQQKRYNEALTYYQRTLRLDQDYANAHFNMGNVYGQLGRLDEAVIHLERAVELRPDFAAAKENLGKVKAIISQLQEKPAP